MFDGKDFEPFGADSTVEDPVWPNPVRPDFLFLKSPSQGLAIERILSQVPDCRFQPSSRL